MALMMARCILLIAAVLLTCVSALGQTTPRLMPDAEASAELARGNLIAAYQLLAPRADECEGMYPGEPDCVELRLAAGETALAIGHLDAEQHGREAYVIAPTVRDRFRALYLVLAGKNLRGDYLTCEGPIFRNAQLFISFNPNLEPALVGRMRSAMAVCLDGSGRHPEAEQFHGLALDALRTAGGASAIYYAAALGAYARSLDSSGRYIEGERYWREALAIAQARNSPQAADYYRGLGVNFAARNRCGEAESLLRLVIPAYRRVGVTFGARLNLAGSYSDLGACVDALGRPIEASELFILASTQGVFGDPFPTQFLGLNSLRGARNALSLRYPETALFRVDSALINLQSFRPSDHPSMAGAFHLRGQILEAMDDFGGAYFMYLKARQVWRRVFQPEHPDRLTGDTTLALFLARRGGADGEARLAFQDAQAGLLERIGTMPTFDVEAQRELKQFSPLFRGKVLVSWRLAQPTVRPAAPRKDRARPRPRSRP